MKILLVHNIYKTNCIGGEDLVFENEKASLVDKLGRENVFVHQVHNDEVGVLDYAVNIFYSKKNYNIIFDLVKKNNIDIVHVHNFLPLLSVSVFKAAKKAGAKVIHTLHNYRFWCINGMFYRKDIGICQKCMKGNSCYGIKYRCFKNSIIQSLLMTTVFTFYRLIKYDKYIDNYFVLTKFEHDKVIELGLSRQKLVLKPNYVKAQNLEILKTNNKEGFLFVGRLEHAKGIIELLNVWKTLSNEYQLTIIGSGPLQSEVENLNLSNIKYIDKKNNFETLEEMNKAKYLLQTSLWYETFGLTIIEAFSMGTPVIGFNIGTRNSFIKNNYNGFICEQEKLRDIIIEAQNHDEYLELSLNAFNSFQEFEEDTIINQQIKLYHSIINNEL